MYESDGRVGRRVKAADVAALAEVSVATVSLVVNGRAAGRVSPATQARVMAAVDQLHYVVDGTARGLATGRRKCVALFVQDVENPFFSSLTAGAFEALNDKYQLILSVSRRGEQTSGIAGLVGFGIDGVLSHAPYLPKAIGPEARLPVVYLDDIGGREGDPRVHFDLTSGAESLADHLLAAGHRRVVYLEADRDWATFCRRRTALVDRLTQEARGTEVRVERIDISDQAGHRIAIRDAARWRADGFTAIVTSSDIQAYGVLLAARELGLEMPGTFALASFDNLRASAMTYPALTSVSLPGFELGAAGAQMLMERLEQGDWSRREVVIPTSLEIRESTSAHPPVS